MFVASVCGLAIFLFALSRSDNATAINGFILMAIALIGAFALYHHIKQLIWLLPLELPANWKGAEIFCRAKSVCLGAIFVGLLCCAAAWGFSQAVADVTVGAVFIIFVFGGIGLLIFGLNGLKRSIFSFNVQGIEHTAYGSIKWSDFDAVQLSVKQIGRGGTVSFLLLYGKNVESYINRLPRWYAFFERLRVGGRRVTDSIMINVDGLNQSPSYIFAGAQRLHVSSPVNHTLQK